MQAEIVSIGTELLLGTIVDTNAAFLAQELAALGIDCFHISQVGDNQFRISELLSLAATRSDLVVLSGGMGPTQDDLARESIAAALGEEMQVVPALEVELRRFFARRGVEMPARNVKQATLIPSAEALPNPVGTAPGWFVTWRRFDRVVVIVAMPGVPFEMKRMWTDQVVPRLQSAADAVLVSKTLKVLGPGESAVDAMLSDLMSGSNPTLAPYAKPDGIHLRITAKASDAHVADRMVHDLEEQVRSRLGTAVYGSGEATPQSAVAGLLAELRLRLVLLEVGAGAAGSLSPLLAMRDADHEGTVLGAVTLPDLGGVQELLNVTDGRADASSSNLEGVLDSLRVRFGAEAALGVRVRTEPVEDIRGPVSAVAEIALVVPAALGAPETATRTLAWQTELSEVSRLVGLASLNVLRLRLIELKAQESG